MLVAHYSTSSQVKTLASKISKSPDHFSFFHPTHSAMQFYTVEHKGIVHGLLAFQLEHDARLLNYCEVGQSFRRQGVARHLIEELVFQSTANQQCIVVSPYEEDGVKGLQPILRRLCAERNIPLIEEGYAEDIANNPDTWQ